MLVIGLKPLITGYVSCTLRELGFYLKCSLLDCKLLFNIKKEVGHKIFHAEL